MSTVNDQINRALRLIGALAEGESPSAATSQDALVALNQMIDSWNTENLSIFSTEDQTFTWPAGESMQTLGPTGDFVGNRPVTVLPSTYFKTSTGTSYVIQPINQDMYNGIAEKTLASNLPQLLFVNNTVPDIQLYTYPVPTEDLEWHIISNKLIDSSVTLATELSFPPGYLRAFVFNLAVEIASEFGIEPPNNVFRIAIVSKRNIKRINQSQGVMGLPVDLIRRGSNYTNVGFGFY